MIDIWCIVGNYDCYGSNPQALFREDLHVSGTEVFHLCKASLSFLLVWKCKFILFPNGTWKFHRQHLCRGWRAGAVTAAGSAWRKKGNLGCTSQKSLAARKKWLEFEGLIPCVETKTLKIEKGNAWNALKQERRVTSNDKEFKTDLTMKQWQFLKGSFKDISFHVVHTQWSKEKSSLFKHCLNCVYGEKGLGFYPVVEVEFCPFGEEVSTNFRLFIFRCVINWNVRVWSVSLIDFPLEMVMV